MADNFNTLDQASVTSAGIIDGEIVNADINASAAIAQSKVANLTTDLATAGEDPAASVLGMKLATMPWTALRSQFTLTAGLCVFVAVRAKVSTSITTLGCWVQTAGVTASGVNGLAIYSAAGALLQKTASMDAEFAATGFKEKAITSQAIVAGTTYYLAALANFSGTNPKIVGNAGMEAGDLVVINGVYPSVYLTAQADFPASAPPASSTLNSAGYFLTAR